MEFILIGEFRECYVFVGISKVNNVYLNVFNLSHLLFGQASSVSIRIGVVHNIPSLDGPSHVIHKFLEAMWQSQRQTVVQAFTFELCNSSVSSPVELTELKRLVQDIKVYNAERTQHCKHTLVVGL